MRRKILRTGLRTYGPLLLAGLMALACKDDDPRGQTPNDGIPPGAVTHIEVRNIPGGAVLSYTLPADEDLLYVKAVYELKDGVPSEVLASLYNDTLQIEGFGDTIERQVKVIAVDRSRNESSATHVSITPLEPPVSTIGKTLDLVPDFGGVHAYWQNPTRAKISVVVLREDHNKEYVPLETFYSSEKNDDGTKREMDTIPANFEVYVQDRWENRSEAKRYALTPIYEAKFDRSKFREVKLPGDIGDCCGWVKSNIWDNVMGDNGFSSPGGTGQWPQAITMDLGIIAKISRMRLFQRQEPYVFAAGNLRKFEIWGSQTLDPSGSWDTWTKITDCESIKPSALPIDQNTAEDIARSHNGEDFIFPLESPKFRYIRIRVNRTWAGGDNFQISELQFFGDTR